MASHVPKYGLLLQCPFERAHLIQASRMQVHLFKCEKQHPKAKTLTCMFNTTHLIPATEYSQHIRSCKDRILVDSFKFSLASDRPKEVEYEPATPCVVVADEADPEVARAAVLSGEDWDDMNEKPYNAAAYCAKNKIIRKATHKTPSEKRNFYPAERMRHADLERQHHQ